MEQSITTDIRAGIPLRVREQVLAFDKKAQVFLFGFQAKGDYISKFSDWNFLILSNQPIPEAVKRAIRDAILEIEWEIEEVISTTFYEKSVWKKLKGTSLYNCVKNEGIEIGVEVFTPKASLKMPQRPIVAHQAGSIPMQIKKTVLAIEPSATVILFGSRARGDYHPVHSDWDFLVLLPSTATEITKSAIRDAILDIELETEKALNTIIYARKAWENLAVTPLYKNIQKEGIQL